MGKLDSDVRRAQYGRSSKLGDSEKWNAELLDENKALKEKLGKLAVVTNPPGKRTLKECEAIIETRIQSDVDAWFALKEIHDRKLYRPKHEDFKDYCEVRWGYRQEGYRYLQAANVTTLLHASSMALPSTSAHARALLPLLGNPEKLKEAWGLALELNDGHPTFLEVKDVVAGFLPPPQPTGNDEGAIPTALSEPPPNSGELGPTNEVSGEGAAARLEPEITFTEGVGGNGAIAQGERVTSQQIGPIPGLETLTPRASDTDSLPFPPDGLWDLASVRSFRGKFNGMIREAAKHIKEPDTRVWFVSLYQFVRQVLEGENLL